jgi:phosphoadenosine phosphosulfate reductase
MKNPGVSKDVISRRTANAVTVLGEIVESSSRAGFASSFGAEDMVLLDLIAGHARQIEVFTLDTGRLPEETYRLMSRARDRYAVPVRIYCPETATLETYIERNGPDAFYQSVAQRRECCHIRKVEPLGRALAGKKSWVTGLRRDQSPTRENLDIKVWDDANGLYKFNPLLEWSLDEVWTYILENDVPYNALHDAGYPSIGCAPCTRAVEPGANIRSGRWWWESADSKECGLHAAESS